MADSLTLADAYLHGELEDLLRKWYATESFDAMSRRLERMGVPASREQVRRWCVQLGIHVVKKAGASA